MKTAILLPSLLAAASLASPFVPRAEPAPQEPDEGAAAAMAEMMAQAERYTKPGPLHATLERFLGQWDTEMRFFMGPQASPPEKGTAEVRWLMDGRWLESRWSGSLMGMEIDGFHVLGYDNFKQSFVMTTVTSMDTAMIRLEGDLDQAGKTLLLYGTLDEYLTGEHDKMVKYLWRFSSPDEMLLEIHDLPIGEANTKVMEVRYTRREA